MVHKAKSAYKHKQSSSDIPFKRPGPSSSYKKFIEIEEIGTRIEVLRTHPQLADQYKILRTIGRGAQGRVYSARDLRTQKIVAIKALSFREISDWKASDLFMREIALLRSMRVNGTPQYLGTIDATASSQPYYFLIQEYIHGKSLQAMLDKGQTFAMEDVISIALAIAPILEQLRQFSPPIVHRDIKPANIMLTPDRKIYLIDFGAAMFHERSTGGSTFAGTAGYMAPEQCMGTSGPESDIYGLGATLIHLATGVPPYKMQTKGMKLQFKRYLPASTPEWFIQLLETMVSPYPCRRARDLNRIVAALRDIPNNQLSADTASHALTASNALRLTHSEDVMRKLHLANLLPSFPASYSRLIPTGFLPGYLIFGSVFNAFAMYWAVTHIPSLPMLTFFSMLFSILTLPLLSYPGMWMNNKVDKMIAKKDSMVKDAFEKFLKEGKKKKED